MSSSAATRWSDAASEKRLRRRYASERGFRLAGLLAVGISVLFLAFLLYSMASKGLGGFVQYEARLPIDFARSDLFLDPATLKGPDARQTVIGAFEGDRKSTRLNSSHVEISYAVFCLKK